MNSTELITLSKNGVWLSDGTEIDHEQTLRIFARSLKKDAAGYFIQIGHETKPIVVEDTAYFVTRIDGNSEQGFELTLNDGSRETLDPSTLNYRPGRLTCQTKGGSEETKFLTAAYFELLKDLHEGASAFYLTIQGRRVELEKKSL